MTINKPTNLDTFSMMQALEEAIRADERAKIKDKIYGFWNQNRAMPTGNNTGMHGEQLGVNPSREPAPLNEKQRKMVDYLVAGWVAIPTLAGNLGLNKSTVNTYMTDLRARGYTIERRNMGRTRNNYRCIFRMKLAG